MGAVATTFMAGVEAIRSGLAKPIGSLTQMGTIRLGKRTDERTPLIKDFVPLAKLDDLVFGGWDIFPDNAYEAAQQGRRALEASTSTELKDFLSSDQADDRRSSSRTTSRSCTAPTSRRARTRRTWPSS